MAVSFDATAQSIKFDSGAGDHLWDSSGTSITVGTLSNGILLALINCYSGNGMATGVRLDNSSGAAFTQYGTGQSFFTSDNVQVFYLLNPPSGSHQIYVEAGYSQGSGILVSFGGVDQTTPISGFDNTNPPTLTAAAGGMIVDGWGATDSETIPVPDASQFSLGTGIDSGLTYFSGSYKQSSGADTMAWTNVSGAYEAIVLAAAGGAGSPSVALGGTATGSITQADIVAGGKTITLTLLNTTWTPA